KIFPAAGGSRGSGGSTGGHEHSLNLFHPSPEGEGAERSEAGGVYQDVPHPAAFGVHPPPSGEGFGIEMIGSSGQAVIRSARSRRSSMTETRSAALPACSDG